MAYLSCSAGRMHFAQTNYVLVGLRGVKFGKGEGGSVRRCERDSMRSRVRVWVRGFVRDWFMLGYVRVYVRHE